MALLVLAEPLPLGRKTLALDLAVAVASDSPCLRHSSVSRLVRVLLYAAEGTFHHIAYSGCAW